MPARKRFSYEHHIRFRIKVFDRKKTAGAPKSGLTFIGNEQRSIPTAKICGGLEIIVSWHDYALALDGLDDERGDSARMQCLFERRKIIERNTNTIGNQGLEPASGYFVAIEGQRAIRARIFSRAWRPFGAMLSLEYPQVSRRVASIMRLSSISSTRRTAGSDAVTQETLFAGFTGYLHEQKLPHISNNW